jgi:CheY-like chemotaxis protein
MGGSVTLNSAPGQGSSFRLTFAANGTPELDDEHPGGDIPPIQTRQRILVADDIASNRMVVRLLLQSSGIEVIEAADGPTALSTLAGSEFDAALLDLNMPGMSGFEIAARIRRGEAGRPDISILAISADSALSRVDTGIDGFDAVVKKPFDQHLLKSTLTSAIQKRARERICEPDAAPERDDGDSG